MKKLDRKSAYFAFHLDVRQAVCRVMNASERARLAEALNPSRQAAHLDVSDSELREAAALLLMAARHLSDMRKFRSYEERKEKQDA